MRDFALAAEVEELRDGAERLARRQLAGNVREAERAGRWPDDVLAVLAGFPLGGLDLPEHLGGVEAGCLAKAVILETLAAADAGGLPAADQPGNAAGALHACPDAVLAAAVATSCLDGSAQAAFTVLDDEVASQGLDWAPAWPAPRWLWLMEGDTLRLAEVTGETPPSLALAFQASGAVTVPFS